MKRARSLECSSNAYCLNCIGNRNELNKGLIGPSLQIKESQWLPPRGTSSPSSPALFSR